LVANDGDVAASKQAIDCTLGDAILAEAVPALILERESKQVALMATDSDERLWTAVVDFQTHDCLQSESGEN
jgi:hypothetical protein